MFDKLTSGFKGSKKNRDEDDSDEDSDNSHDSSDNAKNSKTGPNKQISMLIRVAVVIGIGYLAVDQFFLSNDQPPVVATNVKINKKNKKKKAPNDKTVNKPVAESPKKDAEVTAPKDLAETKPPEPAVAAPIENINIAEKPKEEVVAEKPAEEIVTKVEEIKKDVGESKSSEKKNDENLDKLLDKIDGQEKVEKENSAKAPSKLEEKIVEDDVYTPPPAYDQLGRGLVYNCKDGYWVCVDKAAYVECNKNMKWNKSHGKAIECAVSNIYNSDDDCGVVQKYNVSTSVPTTFCH